jgi:hypothetical protein
VSRSAASPYTPRPIAKVDFDMTRFKMTVERTLLHNTTSNVYYPALPTDATTWSHFIFRDPAANPAATTFDYGLGTGPTFNVFNTRVTLPAVQKSQGATPVYAPGELCITSCQSDAAGVVTSPAVRFKVQTSTNGGTVWTDQYTSSTDEASITYPLPAPTSGLTHVRVMQYLAGGTVTLIDQQVIPVVVDGAASPTASLTDEYIIVPSNGTTVSLPNSLVVTEMKVFSAGADDTANWTFTATPPAGVTGSFGSGPAANRYTINTMTINSAAVDIAATRGATVLHKTLTLTKQGTIAAAASPVNTGRWASVTGPVPTDPFRMYFAPANPGDPAIKSNPDSFAVSAGDLVNVNAPCPWFDGITVYVQSVDAEDRSLTAAGTPNRQDSGVRLWNGRGPVVSLNSATYPSRTGFSFCTNDALYVVGHFNADGTTASPANNGNPARYSDSANEKLAAAMGDAITILSQPTYTNPSGATYYQSGGWSDSLSAHRRDNGGTYSWSSGWATSNPTTSNRQDGTNTSTIPGAMPFLGNQPASAGASPTSQSAKFAAVETEISCCFLIGIVPTNHNPVGLTLGPPSTGPNGQSSGGVHNYPRLLELWSGKNLFIRGSMVAMFESRVAMEPWTLRVYNAPYRKWGLHQSLRDASHDVPLEPIVLTARRMRFKGLTSAEYSDKKAAIETLPH